jgi:hypothetical protein
MEGASGISPANRKAMHHGSEEWRPEGRAFVTSDVMAVCDAANEFGIDEIIIEDEHDSGKREPNLLIMDLPANACVLRCTHFPGKAGKAVRSEPLWDGLCRPACDGRWRWVRAALDRAAHRGDHAERRAGRRNRPRACLAHGSASPRRVGDEAAITEAKALCPCVVGIPVKSLEKDWFPSADETCLAIRRKIPDSLRAREQASGRDLKPPYRFTLAPADGYVFDPRKKMPLRWLVRFFFFRVYGGKLAEREASWEAKTVLRGLYVLHCARMFLRKQAVA